MPVPVEQVGDEYRRVGDVMLRRPGEVLDLDVECAACGIVAPRTAEQRVEHRVAVGPRQAAPDNGTALVHQRVEGTVADDAERKIRRRAAGGLAHRGIGAAAAPSGRDGCLAPSSIATTRRTSRVTSA